MEDGITFGCFLVSLFFFSSPWISARYKWRRDGLLPPPDHSQVEMVFPVRWIHRKVDIELYRSVVGLMGSYDCIRRMIVSFLVSLSFPFLLYGLCSPGGLRLKRGIM
jgi:hypothetical protein